MKAAEENTIKCTLINNLNNREKELLKSKGGHLLFTMINKKTQEKFTFRYPKALDLFESGLLDFKLTAPPQKGEYKCVFSIMTKNGYAVGFNSDVYDVKLL